MSSERKRGKAIAQYRRKRSSAKDTFNDTDFEQLLSQSQGAAADAVVELVETHGVRQEVEVVSPETERPSKRSEFEPLTPSEQSEKQHLENLVIGAVWTAGAALKQLRDKRLYRDTHSSFEQYCREQFGHTRQKSDYLIVGATIYENLTTNRCQILPTTEYQVRPLGVLDPPVQVQAWSEAVTLADGKVPTSRIVKQVVRQLTRQPRENPFELGEVVGILAKEHPQLRSQNGCWAIVTGISKATCDLQTWNAELEGIEIEYLQELQGKRI